MNLREGRLFSDSFKPSKARPEERSPSPSPAPFKNELLLVLLPSINQQLLH